MPCGVCKTSPRTTAVVQCVYYLCRDQRYFVKNLKFSISYSVCKANVTILSLLFECQWYLSYSYNVVRVIFEELLRTKL